MPTLSGERLACQGTLPREVVRNDAFQKVVPGLQAQSGMSYVIAQHLVPKYRSMLEDLLAKQTRMPIQVIEDDTPVEADTIYCRNLLVYLNTELQNKMLSLFHFSLDPDGLLFIGKSESINVDNMNEALMVCQFERDRKQRSTDLIN